VKLNLYGIPGDPNFTETLEESDKEILKNLKIRMSMRNITQEKIENDYKVAIRNKYISQKETDEYSYYLSNPSQALLRDLCRKILKSNPRIDDLNVYRIFFKFDFNPNEENTSVTYTDKFRKIGDLYREGKKSTRINTLDLAAILVDFQPRPFKKFKEKGYIEIDKIEGPSVPKKNPYRPEIFFAKIEDKPLEENGTEIKDIYFKEHECSTNTESAIDEQYSVKVESLNREEDLLEDEIFHQSESFNEVQSFIINDSQIISQENFDEKTIERFIKRILEKSKTKMIMAAIIFSLSFGIYAAFFKKECMQWSGDHYEEVSCDLEVQGYGTFNSPEPYDNRVINLRRIAVCDTTVFFKNEKAIVWYAKVGSNAEFFNTHGIHPENGKALRPITPYIINKYVKKH